MSCPMGQYSLKPYTRELKGDDSGLNSSHTELCVYSEGVSTTDFDLMDLDSQIVQEIFDQG